MRVQKPYKTIFTGVLLQKTAFSIGGNMPNGDVDSPLALDGEERPIIRGAGLAGALIARARRLYEEIPHNVTEGIPGSEYENSKNNPGKKSEKTPSMRESVWEFHHSHLLDEEYKAEIRDGVGIRHKTGAAAEGVRFDIEVVPAGTRWHFLLEVNDYLDVPCYSAASIAAHALNRWRELALLGRDVARGLGWMTLEDIQVIELHAQHVDVWPDSIQTPQEALEALLDKSRERDILVMDLQKYVETRAHIAPNKTCHDVMSSVEIAIHRQSDELEEDVWGLDMLSIGNSGKTDNTPFWEAARPKLIKPWGQGDYAAASDATFDPDMTIVWSCVNGDLQPIIPGSSIRGVLRSVLSALARRQGESVWDPNSNKADVRDDGVGILFSFGHTRQSARLLISDAMLVDDQWQVVVLEKHAEDEFTAGVYQSSKFNRTALVKGKFVFDCFIEADTKEDKEQIELLLRQAWSLGHKRFLPLGGAVNRSMGWVKWLPKGKNHD